MNRLFPLLSVLLLRSFAAGPAGESAATQAGERWRARVLELRREISANPPKSEPAACDECNQGQDMVDACHAVNVDDLLSKAGASSAPHECAGAGGACSVELAALPLEDICRRRAADPKCGEALSPGKAKALDSFVAGMLARCGACYKDKDAWTEKRKELLESFKALDEALGRQDVAAIAAASAEAERRDKCGWTCGSSAP